MLVLHGFTKHTFLVSGHRSSVCMKGQMSTHAVAESCYRLSTCLAFIYDKCCLRSDGDNDGDDDTLMNLSQKTK